MEDLQAEEGGQGGAPREAVTATVSQAKSEAVASSTLFVLDLYDVHSVITAQIVSQLIYWIGAELFNRIMSNRKYLARTKAMQIRMNISTLEDWARLNNRQPEHYEQGEMKSSGETTVEATRRHLAPVIQLLQWLQCFSSLGADDLEALVGTLQQLKSLSPQQLIHAATHYRPEVGEKGLPKSATKYLRRRPPSGENATAPPPPPQQQQPRPHHQPPREGNNNHNNDPRQHQTATHPPPRQPRATSPTHSPRKQQQQQHHHHPYREQQQQKPPPTTTRTKHPRTCSSTRR